MTKRMLTFALVSLVVAASAAAIGAAAYPPTNETLLEGHTVFSTIESLPPTDTEVHYAASVAVLVRESVLVGPNRYFFPGVLWFNDQYLVNPIDRSEGDGEIDARYPCVGAVLAVPAGDPDPRFYAASDFSGANYVESYYVTDPNNHDWNVDKWVINGFPVWSVALWGVPGEAGSDQVDDGQCDQMPYSDAANSCIHAVVPATGATDEDEQCVGAGGGGPGGPVQRPAGFMQSPGDHGYDYPCGGNGGPTCWPSVQYNALLYFRIEDLATAGAPKDHTEGSADWSGDVSACHDGSDPMFFVETWPCPADDDDREGNSHPYNPFTGYPFGEGAGKDNHGGSADCDNDAVPDQNCHATRDVDIYYGVAPNPADREWAVFDTVGNLAPFHCHEGVQCGYEGP